MINDPHPQMTYYSLETVKANEEIAKKFFEIEKGTLAIRNFKDFFEQLLLLIEDKFAIPHVWLSIVNGSEISCILESLESSDLLKKRLNLIGKITFSQLVQDAASPLLVNDNLKPYYKLLPHRKKYFVKSLAIAPLVYEDKLIGSLNLGDYSASRFEPSMDIFFLSQLAVKISICLSNITAHEKLNYLATRDSLTDLLNRRELDRIIKEEFSNAQTRGTHLSLLLIDCNNLKAVNELHGYTCGDALLSYAATQITKTIHRDGFVFRLAGDQFAILMPGGSSKDVSAIAKQLHGLFEKYPLRYGDQIIPISISCGVSSTADTDVCSAVSLLEKSARSLYEVKNKKRSSQADVTL
ncbi:MAG TPA: GGDEF domain-containing protein [Deltaproteobacteria bacterium]|nr:GGDEF domain-containing protein [Deltaproteobacteria bacterium]